MTLLYRAIWDEDRPGLVEVSDQTFRRWLEHKRFRIPDLTGGEAEFDSDGGSNRLLVRRVEHAGLMALRASLAEQRHRTGETWTTTLTAIAPVGGSGGTLWVDVQRVSKDPFTRPPFRAPVLVRLLIEEGIAQGGRPRVGHVFFECGVKAIDATSLAGLVQNESRRLTLAVFAHDDVHGVDVTRQRATAAYQRLAGVAQIYLLPPDHIEAFKERVGEELAVWGGAARLYLPNTGPTGLRPERHWYVPARRMQRSPEAAGDEFVARLSTMVTATPPPDDYERIRRHLDGSGSDDAEKLLEFADSEIARLEREINELRSELASKDDSYIDLLDENEDLQLQLNRAAANLQILATSNPADERPPGDGLPDDVATIADAIEFATRLEFLEIHPDAPRDIEQLDAQVQRQSWARSIWRGLRALDEYARRARTFDGGFWQWCEQGSAIWAWPATSKKLAMTESKTVMNSGLRDARKLPVSSAVSKDGRIEMFAHLKIAEGGGTLAPRIYFLDDTKGVTGKVHIGFIGPHSHMPNTKT